jgi:hypothetical protein
MADTASIQVLQQSPYRGGLKEWSNRMHFGPGFPPDAGHWNALYTDIRDSWKTITLPTTEFIGARGYQPGTDVPVWETSDTTVGTYVPGTGVGTVLESCALTKYTTDQRTSKNHPIYLFEWHHGVMVVNGGSYDELLSGLHTGWKNRGDNWIAGITDGTSVYHRQGPRGASGLTASVDLYVHHRDFPN